MSQLNKYSSFLGIGGNSNLENHIHSIINSGLIQQRVISDIKPDSLDTKLELSDRINLSVNKNNLISLIYSHSNKDICLKVIQRYLHHLTILNEELEISAQKNIIRILDPPIKPTKPTYPKKRRNLVITLIASFILGSLASICYASIKKQLR